MVLWTARPVSVEDREGFAAAVKAALGKVGATVRFVQAASFPQQREETLPGDALARERERELTFGRERIA